MNNSLYDKYQSEYLERYLLNPSAYLIEYSGLDRHGIMRHGEQIVFENPSDRVFAYDNKIDLFSTNDLLDWFKDEVNNGYLTDFKVEIFDGEWHISASTIEKHFSVFNSDFKLALLDCLIKTNEDDGWAYSCHELGL